MNRKRIITLTQKWIGGKVVFGRGGNNFKRRTWKAKEEFLNNSFSCEALIVSTKLTKKCLTSFSLYVQDFSFFRGKIENVNKYETGVILLARKQGDQG